MELNKKFIETISINDFEVLTDEGFIDIENLHKTIKYEKYILKLNNGVVLGCADNHIVFDENMDEIYVKNLKLGMSIQTDIGLIKVESIKNTKSEEHMFDLELKKNSKHRYYTNGILSHNTELCKVLAEYLFNSKDNLIKLDMSEYMESHTVSKMIGSPPGYVGYDEGGQLTEMVRTKPYSVILLDEIEKAHPEVANIFLQILDEGKLTDSLGRTVDFKNTIIIMTSNVGSKELFNNKPLGFSTGVSEDINTNSIIEKALNKKFKPEFLNRIDEQIIFKQLTKDNVRAICKIHLKQLFERVIVQGYKIETTEALDDYLIEEGYSLDFGARPVLRAITKYVQTPLSIELLLGKFKKGDTIVVDYDKKNNKTVARKKTVAKKKTKK